MLCSKHGLWLATSWLCLGLAASVSAEPSGQPLLDGKDLTGWVNVNAAPETWQVRDAAIVSSGKPSGFLRTARMYENYVLELDWRQVSQDTGAAILVHADALPHVGSPYPKSVEIRVRPADRGSILGIGGCKIRPLGNPQADAQPPKARPVERQASPVGGSNHCRLTSRDGTLELAVNGQVAARAADATQIKGYICLKSEGAEVQFSNIRLKELPSSNPPQEKVAAAAEGFTSIFDGLTYRGWKHHEGLEGRWEIDDGVFRLREVQPPRKRGQDTTLWHERTLRDFVLIADWRLIGKPERKPMNDFTEDGLIKRNAQGQRIPHEILHAGDSGIYLRGEARAQVNIWSQTVGSGDINSYHKDIKLSPEIRRACMPKTNADNPPGQWNRFQITLRGDRVTVVLNGQTVIDDAFLPDVAKSGPIGLQNHGDPIEFRNLFLKTLE
jgi:hypothetical protein